MMSLAHERSRIQKVSVILGWNGPTGNDADEGSKSAPSVLAGPRCLGGHEIEAGQARAPRIGMEVQPGFVQVHHHDAPGSLDIGCTQGRIRWALDEHSRARALLELHGLKGRFLEKVGHHGSGRTLGPSLKGPTRLELCLLLLLPGKSRAIDVLVPGVQRIPVQGRFLSGLA